MKKSKKITEAKYNELKGILNMTSMSKQKLAKVVGFSPATLSHINLSEDFKGYRQRVNDVNLRHKQKLAGKVTVNPVEVDPAKLPKTSKTADKLNCPENDVLVKILERLNDIEQTQRAQVSVANDINSKLDLVAVPKRRFR